MEMLDRNAKLRLEIDGSVKKMVTFGCIITIFG